MYPWVATLRDTGPQAGIHYVAMSPLLLESPPLTRWARPTICGKWSTSRQYRQIKVLLTKSVKPVRYPYPCRPKGVGPARCTSDYVIGAKPFYTDEHRLRTPKETP